MSIASRLHKRAWGWPLQAVVSAAILLSGCGGGGSNPPANSPGSPPTAGSIATPDATPDVTPDAPPATTDLGAKIQTLSSKPDMISGGDTLLEVSAPDGLSADMLRIELNGKDVTAQLPVVSDNAGVRRGLLEGLTTEPDSAAGSRNTLVVSRTDNPLQRTTATLVNFPITGPIFSGPHLAPYECRTVQNRLGPALDDNCSAQTQVQWYYGSTNPSVPTLQLLSDPTGPRPADLATVTTNTGAEVPYIVRLESGTINRGVYRLAVLDDPSSGSTGRWQPGPGWNKKLVTYFNVAASAQYNQGVLLPEDIVTSKAMADIYLSTGYALLASTELWNNQHANAYLQGETLMMLKEHIIETFGEVPKWTAGIGGSGGAIQQYQIARLFPGLLDGLQPSISFAGMPFYEATDCRLLAYSMLPNYRRLAPGIDLSNIAIALISAAELLSKDDAAMPKLEAVSGLPRLYCLAWDKSFADIVRSESTSVCGFQEQVNINNVFNRALNPNGVRCDVMQTNVNVLGMRPGTKEARRPLDNVGVQYGLKALNDGKITVQEFLDLNASVGGFDRDGNMQSGRTEADDGAIAAAHSTGWINNFDGASLASIPIITQRNNAGNQMDIHDPMQDFIIRARLQKANEGRSDNQVIWIAGLSLDEKIQQRRSMEVMNEWLDKIAADPAEPSMEKVHRNKPDLAVDTCWDKSNTPITEKAIEACAGIYPLNSTPRLVAGAPVDSAILKCQRKDVDMNDYKVAFTPEQERNLRDIFSRGVCDWSKPGEDAKPLKGTYLRLPLAAN